MESNSLLLFFSPQNLIAQSQSGTGKTAAFVLAMLSHVDPNNKYPQVGVQLPRCSRRSEMESLSFKNDMCDMLNLASYLPLSCNDYCL